MPSTTCEQFQLLLHNHGVWTLEVGISHPAHPGALLVQRDTTMWKARSALERRTLMRDVFDLPDLAAMDDGIANGTWQPKPGEAQPAVAVHRAARGLFAAPPAPLHRHLAARVPELCAVHQLPVLYRRIRAPGP